jgi:phosphoglycolate phosphatase-like HAD superfamily hydrolase
MPNAESGITIDRYCVAIALRSGADVQKTKTFLFMSRATHGCLSRVGVVPPKVTITADDPRLRVGKPGPDPFLLAAGCLCHRASCCVVFEDSPRGIKAGVAAGAIVVAVCKGHARGQIEECGAHFVLENLEDVRSEEIKTDEGTRLMFSRALTDVPLMRRI